MIFNEAAPHACAEIIAYVMNTLISKLVVPGEADIYNANSHGEP